MYCLPFVDKTDPKAEFYLAQKHGDETLYILKIFDKLRHDIIQSSGTVILLHYRLADCTFSHVIASKHANNTVFSMEELKTFFSNSLITLFTFQRTGIAVPSLHPDFIFYDKMNAAYYVKRALHFSYLTRTI